MRTGGYIDLLRRNWRFRRLWYGQITSQLGDWLDAIALYTILLKLTGKGEAVGALLVAQFLPSTVVGLGAGVVVDRLPRKWVMVVADLGCAALVLLFLFVHDVSQVWIIYVVTVLKVGLTSFFEPAREAVVPTLAAREDLVLANGLSGVTWSVMLTGGAALGGLVVGTLGTEAAFLLDSASFFLSAAITASIPIDEPHLEAPSPAGPFFDLLEGFRYLFGHGDVALYATSKSLWSLGGGVLVLLTLYGREVFPLGENGGLSIGLLYAARGVGAGLGPLLALRWGGDGVVFLRRMIGPGFFLMALGYVLLGATDNLPLAALVLVLAHIGGSTQWVFSTALLQLTVPQRLQGRIFAVELAMLTLATSVSSYATGVAADAGWSPQLLALVLGLVFVPSGVFMTLVLWRKPAVDADQY